MTYDNQRSYERYGYETQVQYACSDEKKYYDAKMCNYSNGGMYFETPYPVEEGSKLYIKMKNYSPSGSGPEAYETYYGKAKWVAPYAGSDTPYYGVGVQYKKSVDYS